MYEDIVIRNNSRPIFQNPKHLYMKMDIFFTVKIFIVKKDFTTS